MWLSLGLTASCCILQHMLGGASVVVWMMVTPVQDMACCASGICLLLLQTCTVTCWGWGLQHRLDMQPMAGLAHQHTTDATLSEITGSSYGC